MIIYKINNYKIVKLQFHTRIDRIFFKNGRFCTILKFTDSLEYIELFTALTVSRNLFKADERVNRGKRFPLKPLVSIFNARERIESSCFQPRLNPKMKTDNFHRVVPMHRRKLDLTGKR